MRKALTKQEMQSAGMGMGMRGGRNTGGRPYDYDRGFNQGTAYFVDSGVIVILCDSKPYDYLT